VPFEAVIQGQQLSFDAGPKLFSPSDVDHGTRLLLTSVQLAEGDKVLDLGCGYGVIGIYVARLLCPARVYMIYIDPEAVKCAESNAHRNAVDGVHITVGDGFKQFNETGFTKILCNPPYHRDFSVAKHFIEKGFNRLAIGGSMWLVTKRDKWYRNKLTSVFGGVRVVSQDSYLIFEAVKKRATYATHLAKQPKITQR